MKLTLLLIAAAVAFVIFKVLQLKRQKKLDVLLPCELIYTDRSWCVYGRSGVFFVVNAQQPSISCSVTKYPSAVQAVAFCRAIASDFVGYSDKAVNGR